MRSFNSSIILGGLLFSSSAFALDFSLDVLEWRATQTDDWSYTNSLTVPNQIIKYNTLDYSYKPGYRLGLVYVKNWDAAFYYTHYYTKTYASASGNVLPSFMGSTTAKPKNIFDPTYAYFYQSGHVSSAIAYNIFDLDFGKRIELSPALMIHPFAGLIGGWIDETQYGNFQGTVTTAETVKNNFTGIGPKVGIDASIRLLNRDNNQLKLIGMFAPSYVLGHWSFSDFTRVTPPPNVRVSTPGKNMGTVALQAMLGLEMNYKQFSVKLAYEMSDWFNMDAFYDNDSGSHNNDLILQGGTLGFTYSIS